MLPLLLVLLSPDPSCNPVFNALKKSLGTPAHVYASEIKIGRVTSYEEYYTGTAVYYQTGSAWVRGPQTIAQMVQQQDANLKRATAYTCKLIRSDTIDGQATSVFALHSVTGGGVSDGQIWITRDKGLPLKQEMDVDMGITGGKSHRSTRYDYLNIKPPMGIR